MFPENTGIAMSRRVLFSRQKREGRRKNTKTHPRARENVCGVNEMCFCDRPACFSPSSPPRPLGLKARTCYTWTKFLATTFKTRFEGRTFRVAKVCLSRTSKRTITRLLRGIRADVQIFLCQPLALLRRCCK